MGGCKNGSHISSDVSNADALDAEVEKVDDWLLNGEFETCD